MLNNRGEGRGDGLRLGKILKTVTCAMAVSLIMLSTQGQAFAQQGKGRGRFTYGLEWGVMPQLAYHYDYSYRSEMGFAAEGDLNKRCFHINGTMLSSLGYDIPLGNRPKLLGRRTDTTAVLSGSNTTSVVPERYLNVSILTGWEGLYAGYRVFPVMVGVKGSPFHRHPQHLLFGAIGAGIAIDASSARTSGPKGLPVIANFGYAYRIPLGHATSMDIKAGLRYSYSHPAVEVSGEILELGADEIYRSNYDALSLMFTLALTL